MPNRITLRTLRSALCVLRSSFLAYLEQAPPYSGPGDEGRAAVLQELTARRRALEERVLDLIRDLGGEAEPCDFPAEYTSANDLAIGYVMARAERGIREDSARLRDLRDEQADPRADALLEEAIEELEAIRGCLAKASARTAPTPG